ncbi:MAG: hypothetical protein Q4A74_02955 [Cardiobacteriaceae bacterium]|nr:hypothetical protein [Cardiobacteriaceae bacterium]
MGISISTADALIAANALSYRMMVASRDEAPFQAAGVSVINPWTS